MQYGPSWKAKSSSTLQVIPLILRHPTAGTLSTENELSRLAFLVSHWISTKLNIPISFRNLSFFLRSRVQKFPAWRTKAAQMENAVRDI